MSANAVAWFGKYTLAGKIVAQGEGWVTIAIQRVTQDGESLPQHHLTGQCRSFSESDVLLSD